MWRSMRFAEQWRQAWHAARATARLAIGVAAEAVFLAYVFILGRRAHDRGQTGDIDASLLEDRVATAS